VHPLILIELDKAIFPIGTTGYILDVLARKALWSSGLDYRHGTGHGVGSFLNVHEGPQGVGQRPGYNDIPLAEGHVISNEPGYYADGKFGIRIENVQVCKKVETQWNFGDKGYLGFEHFTMVCFLSPALAQGKCGGMGQARWGSW
jgi:Xaa-Pro aminopeptidase